ncbi:uncharacterized protein [Garra rufa]|uniref:uncharacterized protein n=1 Tax=Garra rufa TaxID=137080 RepID=UPI003CCECB10
MLAVENALARFCPRIKGSHVLVRSDNVSVVSYINRQGGLRSRNLYRLAERLLVWAQCNLRSLRAVHVPGLLNVGQDRLSRNNVPAGEWSLHPQTVQLLRKNFGRAEVDLFASQDNAHCPEFFSKSKDALAHVWPLPPLYAFPPISFLPQVIERIKEDGCSVLLVAPFWENQPWFPALMQLTSTAPWPVPVKSLGVILDSTLNHEQILCAAYSGNRVHWHCTDDTSTTCVPCPSLTFTDEPNGLTDCFPCTVCDANRGLRENKVCTRSSDTVCEPLERFYCIDKKKSSCTLAVQHSECSPGQYIKQAGTGSTDTVCADCTGETYSNGSFSSCLSHTKCEATGRTETHPGTHSSDSECGNPPTPVAVIATSVIVILIIIVLVCFFTFKHIQKKKRFKSSGRFHSVIFEV